MRFQTALVVFLLAISESAAALTVRGIVRENELGGRGIPNVPVSAFGDGNPVRTNADGSFFLQLPNKEPGDPVQLIVQNPPGMVVVNDGALQFVLAKTTSADPVVVLLSRADERQEMARRFHRLDRDPVARGDRTTDRATAALVEQLRADVSQLNEKARREEEERAFEKALDELRIASLHTRLEQPAEARHAFETALKITRALAERNRVVYLPTVAAILNELGALHLSGNRRDEARTAFEEAHDLYRELVQLNPETYRPRLADVLVSLGRIDRDRGALKEARVRFDESLVLVSSESTRRLLYDTLQAMLPSYRERAQQSPTYYLPYVAETLADLARLDRDGNRMEDARKHVSEALSIYEDLERKANPTLEKRTSPFGRQIDSTRKLLQDSGGSASGNSGMA
jgi:tetratricopeptide (TPR) repeat protein